MYFQIKEIILWSKNKALQPRRLIFEIGKINVISGASRTGKSAIIPIIDYCLGSENCSIPVKTIRDTCDWFGILVQTANKKILIARREPGNQKSTGDMFLQEGLDIQIPDHIPSDKIVNIKAIKLTLDELAGLTNLDFDVNDSDNSFLSRPSFRDFGAFVFQPQNIVANPDILFYKADTYEHREKLKTIFPYVLNAINPEILALQHELNQLRKELKKKQNEIETLKQLSEKWVAEIKSQVSQAKELGLLDRTYDLNDNKDRLIDALKEVVQRNYHAAQVTEETINDAITELIQLKTDEADISLQLSMLRKRFSEMSELKSNVVLYKDTLLIQRDRLKVSEWLQNTYDENHECPVCGHSMDEAGNQLSSLLNSLGEIEQTVSDYTSIPPAFDREFERVRTDIRLITEKLNGIRMRRESLENKSSEVRNRQYESYRVERFIGSLDKSIEIYQSIGTDSDLIKEVEKLKERITITRIQF